MLGGSVMFIPDPDFDPSQIPDPITAKKGGKFVVQPNFVATNHKTENYFTFEREKNKCEPI
jgi:hypothetical protein